jgi:hypothetical protein
VTTPTIERLSPIISQFGAVLRAPDAGCLTLLLADIPDLARAELKILRYRLLHTAARLTRGQCRLWLCIQASRP